MNCRKHNRGNHHLKMIRVVICKLGTSFVFLAICIISAKPSKADDVVHPVIDENVISSAEKSANSGYYEIYGGSGQDVLLLDDANTAGTTALINALTTAGFNVTHRQPPEYTWNTTDPPLDDFACVVHLNGPTFSNGLSASSAFALNEFVRTGGGFIGSQWNGFERVQGRQANMNDLVLQLWPGPFNCANCTPTWTVVSGQVGHPVLASIPVSFTFFAEGHSDGALVIFGTDPSTVLMRAQTGGPAVTVREFGDGRVVNFATAANYLNGTSVLQNTTIQQLYVNAAEYVCQTFDLTIDEADIKEDAEKTKDNEMEFSGTTDLASFGPDEVVVTVSSDSQAPFNSVAAVTIPAAEFVCDLVECVAEVENASQTFQGEALKLEVTIALDGSTFDVEVENVETDVDNPPVEVTLTLKVGNKIGTDTVIEVEKDPGERLQFEVPD